MLYSEIIAVCSQTHIKYINSLCGQNVQLLNLKPAGTYHNPIGCERLNIQLQLLRTYFLKRGRKCNILRIASWLVLVVLQLRVSHHRVC